MPISPLVLQRRHAELGRIRTGHKGAKGQPVKLTMFRFTSPNERYIKDIATLYGGEAKAWDNGGKPEWEVYTEAKSIPVLAIKGGMSQWMETWSGGGCTHRCDGITDDKTKQPCNPDDPKHKAAKPYTRLSVMLPELEAIGVWRLESHGYNAAAELPNAAELAAHVGDMVKANLTLVERRTVSDGKTNRFVVPVLDLEISQRRLIALAEQMSGFAPQIAGVAAAQIEAAPGLTDELVDDIADCETVEQVKVLWEQLGSAGRLTDDVKARLTAQADAIKADAPQIPDAAASTPAASGPAPDSDGVVDAEIVDDGKAELFALQQQIITAAGQKGQSTTEVLADLEQTFAQPVDDLTADQLREYLAKSAA